ncbi:hypothetical protein BCR43DRAFT_169039 [Syncephalastrum racemosum]|uniref:Uncharacterized protein n=1 Tax=Syncephalastrum racemosum TaxID=13706 RepID=A0A1X2HP39_SYNRA|nr:hypothetical protein BCR43DRAFT_169039 [Syncephalastrum racemosum]
MCRETGTGFSYAHVHLNAFIPLSLSSLLSWLIGLLTFLAGLDPYLTHTHRLRGTDWVNLPLTCGRTSRDFHIFAQLCPSFPLF